MSPEAATRLLTCDLPAMRVDLARELLRLTGHWPLLLAIVNSRLREQCARGAQVDTAADTAIRQLQMTGPTAFDITVISERAEAVSATLEYSMEWLTDKERTRFLDLGVFPEDADVPVSAVALLWGCSVKEADRICERLHDLSLLSMHWIDRSVAVITIHDVIRTYLRSASGHAALTAANGRFIDQARTLSPQWWNLASDNFYLWNNLALHLNGAGLDEELDALVTSTHRCWATGLCISGW